MFNFVIICSVFYQLVLYINYFIQNITFFILISVFQLLINIWMMSHNQIYDIKFLLINNILNKYNLVILFFHTYLNYLQCSMIY